MGGKKGIGVGVVAEPGEVRESKGKGEGMTRKWGGGGVGREECQ